MQRGKSLTKVSQNISTSLKRLRWVDVAGAGIFFFILASSIFFVLRRSSYVTLTIRLIDRDAPDFYFNLPKNSFVEKLKPGIRETDGLGRTTVEVLNVYRYYSSNIYHDVYVTLKVKSVYNKMTKQHSYNGQPLLIGGYRIFRLQNILLAGYIVDMNETLERREQKSFLITGFLNPSQGENLESVADTITLDGVQNSISDSVNKGLKILDSQNSVVAEVVSVDKKPGTIKFVADNRYVSVVDPERTRVEIKVKILAEKINDAYYYQKFGQLSLNQTLNFVFDTVNIWATITSIKPAD